MPTRKSAPAAGPWRRPWKLWKPLCKKQKVDLKPIIAELHEIREDEFIGPSTYSIVAEAASRNIPYIQLKNSSIIQLGYGVNQKRIWATTTSLHLARGRGSGRQ